ncbi:MAG: peptidase M16 [Rhodospirillaceae bacterium]|nr:peptidase M16 [Rhodospirillaceae bacterium]MDG1275137.1 pitrilysin family protein [Alphaproteobacteria bacterium]MDG1887218.1 pitrilysin family protein [Alphaproteobacteria bacterium]|tara:strand:+ start:964 stop:2229 length:1266 start_codon:yes stop_codon:yes gene_type:complete
MSESEAQVTELTNGIRVVSDKMESVESVSMGAWFGIGTRNESVSVNGVAHVLEHMAFKGTKKRRASEIAEEIELVGGHLNAYTSREQTAYYAKLLKDDIGLGIDILADILQNSTFEEEELERERSVILQEIGQAADTPDDIIFDHFQATAYPGQALGRPVLGTADIVGKISRNTVIKFITDNYGGGQMVFSAAGNVDHEDLVDRVQLQFSSLPQKAVSKIEPANYLGGDWRQYKDLEQVHLILGFPAATFYDPDFYAQQVLSMLLGGGMSSRLFQEVREKRGLVYSIYSFTSAYRDSGMLGIYAGTGEREIQELIPVVCEELLTIIDCDLDSEVQRSKTQLRSGLLMSRETNSNRCEQMAQHLLVHGQIMTVSEIIEKVDAVDTDSVRRVAKKIIATKPTLTALGPISNLESYQKLCDRLR